MINPVMGRRCTLAWMAPTALPIARATYTEIGREAGRTFFRELPITRFFADEGEKEALAAMVEEYFGKIKPSRTGSSRLAAKSGFPQCGSRFIAAYIVVCSAVAMSHRIRKPTVSTLGLAFNGGRGAIFLLRA